MNIHFSDKKLFESLKKATIEKVVVGSTMYGSNTEKSDIDYLYIYATSELELNSFIQVQHQLQYNEDGVDHVFVSLHTFIRNIISGDSTINFEVLHSEVLIGGVLKFLNDSKNNFITYTIIRSYLGIARRDIKYYHKADTDYLKKKRLGHIIRGYLYANSMFNNTFDFKSLNVEFVNIFKNIDISNNKELKLYENKISVTRLLLTERFNNNELGLPQYIDVDECISINKSINELIKSDYFKEKQSLLIDSGDFLISLFINSFENWVDY